MRHVAIFGNNLETLDCLCIPYDIIEVYWTILLDPTVMLALYIAVILRSVNYQGNS